MDPIKPWDYCDCDPPPKLYVGDNGVIQDVINGQPAHVPSQYQTDTTPIPTGISIATSIVPHSALPTADTSFDSKSFQLKSFQFPDSMPVYSFKGKCLRHCSTSDSDYLSDHYPFQVSVFIRDRIFRKVFSFSRSSLFSFSRISKTLKAVYLFAATLFLLLLLFYLIVRTGDIVTVISKSLLTLIKLMNK